MFVYNEQVILETKELTKKFRGLTAVNNVSLRIRKGSMTGIIGPNGAGKSTLFNSITGYLKVDHGSVIFKNEEITNEKPFLIVRRGIARTFQVPQCCKQLTVRENIRLSCLINKKASEENIYKVAKHVNIEEKLDALTANLPIGNLRQVELAMALGTEPELLLLDEPFSGLNDFESNELLEIILNLNKKGQTLVIIDHKLKFIMQLVEKVIVLHQGAILASGAPAEIVLNKEVQNAYLGVN